MPACRLLLQSRDVLQTGLRPLRLREWHWIRIVAVVDVAVLAVASFSQVSFPVFAIAHHRVCSVVLSDALESIQGVRFSFLIATLFDRIVRLPLLIDLSLD